MHIAFLFSGHKRSFLKHKERWKELIRELEDNGATVHCFYHSWTEDCLAKQVGKNRMEGIYVKKPLENREAMLDNLPFKHGWFEEEEKVIKKLLVPKHALLLNKQAAKINIALQLYSMQRSYEAMKIYEKQSGIVYTTIVKLRFDIEPRRWSIREFLLFDDNRFDKLLIASNNAVHSHPGGGGGCLACDRKHQEWWEQQWKGKKKEGPEPEDALWQHDGPHSNDICDLYAIGNQETMGRYMTVYSRLLQLYPPSLFEQSLKVAQSLPRSLSQEGNDWRISANGKEMEREDMACFYPERLQRINLEGLAVLHAASMFYRD